MLERIAEALHLAYRQVFALTRVGDFFRTLTAGGFSFKKLTALIVALAEMLPCIISDEPLTPLGDELSLDGYSLVFCDEFDGDSLNREYWRTLGGGDGAGYRHDSMITVEDGALTITGKYLEDGPYGPAWYAADMELLKTYKRGYFEIRCKCNDYGDLWSAFWIQADHPYDHDVSKGGPGGAEIDIFEATYAKSASKAKRNSIVTTVHCNGGDDDPDKLDSRILGNFRGKDIYNTYNTYGVKWTENEYIFYINGVETARSSFSKGVSEVEEHVRVTMCIPKEVTVDRSLTSRFVIDYVKIWQTA